VRVGAAVIFDPLGCTRVVGKDCVVGSFEAKPVPAVDRVRARLPGCWIRRIRHDLHRAIQPVCDVNIQDLGLYRPIGVG